MADTRVVENVEPAEFGFDRHLGTAAELLEHRGETKGAALLLDASDLGYAQCTTSYMVWEMEYWNTIVEEESLLAIVACEPVAIDRFTDDIKATLIGVLNEVNGGEGRHVDELRLIPTLSDEAWRERLEKRLGANTETNQARVRPLKGDELSVDTLIFRSGAEVKVYEALKRANEKLPQERSLLIAPNVGIRVHGRILEVDFLITYRGRAGVIEVDSIYHRGRRDFDKSKEKLLEDAGIAYVDRVSAEDCDDSSALDQVVSRFLDRLAE
jgi:hypothetical protein